MIALPVAAILIDYLAGRMGATPSAPGVQAGIGTPVLCAASAFGPRAPAGAACRSAAGRCSGGIRIAPYQRITSAGDRPSSR